MYRTQPERRPVKVIKQLTKAEVYEAITAFISTRKLANDALGSEADYEFDFLDVAPLRVDLKEPVFEFSWEENVVDE